jgi:hypothetical protein
VNSGCADFRKNRTMPGTLTRRGTISNSTSTKSLNSPSVRMTSVPWIETLTTGFSGSTYTSNGIVVLRDWYGIACPVRRSTASKSMKSFAGPRSSAWTTPSTTSTG